MEYSNCGSELREDNKGEKQNIKNSKKRLRIVAFAVALMLMIPCFSLLVGCGDDTVNEEITWSDLLLGDLLPEPGSNVGWVMFDSQDILSVYINDTSMTEFYDYTTSCRDMGFTIEADQSSTSFNAYNESGYKVSAFFKENEKKMEINLFAPPEYGELEWPGSGYGSLLPVPLFKYGKIEKDDESGFEAVIAETSLEELKAYAKECSDAGFSEDVAEWEVYYSARNAQGNKLTLEYAGFNTMSVKVDEPEYKVNIEVECVENAVFSRYDIDVYIDNSFEDTLEHGTTKTYSVYRKKGTYTIEFISTENDDITGTVSIDVAQNEDFKFTISCYDDGLNVVRD
ncbi:MAG: hypothetical protein GX222_04280 [Ruminococcaceae bacterium]|nr:hypothetical protein [Oscillospiraceae bacterium]